MNTMTNSDYAERLKVILPDAVLYPSYDGRHLHTEIFEPFDGFISFTKDESSGELHPYEFDVECETIREEDYQTLATILKTFPFKQVFLSYRIPLLNGGWDYTGNLYIFSGGTSSASVSVFTDDDWFNREKAVFDTRDYENVIRTLTTNLCLRFYGRKLKEAIAEATESYLTILKQLKVLTQTAVEEEMGAR